jgi:multiple sugar transport system substrate-binding protein
MTAAWRRIMVASVVALALAACHRAPPSGRVTLRFWGLGREGEVVGALVPAFERENPGVRVEVQQIPWTAAHEKLLTAFVGDAAPDIAQIGNTWIPEFAALNALEPLDARIEASAEVKPDRYFTGIWDTNVVGGATYGVPWYVDTRLLFYRTDILAAAGVRDVPRTWTDWRSAMARLKAHAGPGQYAILLPIDEWAQPVIFALEAGSDLLRGDDSYGAFEEEPFRTGFAFYVGLFRDGFAPALGNTNVANVYQQFGDGTFPMYITGPWNLGEFRRRLPASARGEWSTAPMPAFSGSDWPGVSLAGGASLTVFRRCTHKQVAWRFVEFLSRVDQQVAFYKATGDLPARRAAWQEPSLARDPQAQAFRVQLEHVRSTPKIAEWERIATAIADAADAVVRGGRSTDAALADLDRQADTILEKRRWMLRHRQEGR